MRCARGIRIAAVVLADAVATPGSGRFHRYLSPDGYTARFGPSAAHARVVADWLTAAGLTGVHTSRGRDYVSATGPGSRLRSVPARVAPYVLGVTGRGGPASTSSVRRRAKAARCSRYWAQHVRTFRPAYRGLTSGSLPVCGYSARHLRAAYGVTWADTGVGQTVALTEGAAPAALAHTLAEYARRNHLPKPRPGQIRQVRTGTGCGPTARAAQAPAVDDEAEMDAEAVYAMAPRAKQVMVIGGGCDEDQALLDAAQAVVAGDGHRPLASIASHSWQIPIGVVPERVVHAIDVRAAAEGVGMYVASGDTTGLTATDSDPYAVAVGGTSLGVGRTGGRAFETGWSSDSASLDHGKWTGLGVSGAGGGTSRVYGRPAYQKGVVPASMSRVRVGGRTVVSRAVPDIAAVADPDTGMLTGYTPWVRHGRPGPYRTQPNAGTSLATPLVAGLVADAQQGRATPFGFVDPLLYRLAGTPAFHDVRRVTGRAAYVPATGAESPTLDVFDVQDRGRTRQVTAPGYDTTTGLGTPNGAAFRTGLRLAAPAR